MVHQDAAGSHSEGQPSEPSPVPNGESVDHVKWRLALLWVGCPCQRLLRRIELVKPFIDFRTRRKCISPSTTIWSTHSRRIDPINLSAKPFCQGEPGAMGLSRMPIALSRRVAAAPYT